jgi:iron only hydrogenase large subunit-like protein
MAISARMAKGAYPDAVIVFIGPCLAKRAEGLSHPDVDHVLTFDELGAILEAVGVEVKACAPEPMSQQAKPEGRGFPVSGGVARAIQAYLPPNAVALKPIVVSGLDRKALARLQLAATRGCEGNIIEVMCCEGGCMNGPGVLSNPVIAGRKLAALLAADEKSVLGK